MSSIPKNRQNFYFQKITGTLKMNIFLKVGLNLPITSKTNCQNQNSKLEVVQHFFFFSICRKQFLTKKIVKKILFRVFSSYLALKKNKEHILFQVKPLKMSNKSFFVLVFVLFWDFRGFLRPCFAMRRVKKQQIKVKFWI